MRLFVSYSSKDSTSVKTLIRDLEAARHAVWVDQELTGGDSWWRQILQQIRQCDVFVLALSNNALRSKPCMAELDYAKALGLPVVPVQIGPVDRPRLSPISHIQIIDYRNPTAPSAIALVAALQDSAARRGKFPEPLPEPPPIPYEYLMRLSAQIDSPALGHTEQLAIMAQLRDSLETEDDDIRADLDALLRRLRSRFDVTFRIANEIDTLLRQHDNTATQNSPETSKREAPTPGQPAGTFTAQLGLASPSMPPTAGRPQQLPPHRQSPSGFPPIISPPTPPSNRWRTILAIALGILSIIGPLSAMALFGGTVFSIAISLLSGIIGITFAIAARSRREPQADLALMISIVFPSLLLIFVIIGVLTNP